MSFFNINTATEPAYSSNIHRPRGDITGLRQVQDDVSRLSVVAFPAAMITDIVPSQSVVAACYILADHEKAYIGETGNLGRRLTDHASDPSKAFAREVYVVTGLERAWFDKSTAISLQFSFTRLAERAGLVDVVKGTNPQQIDLSVRQTAVHDRIVEYGMRLLFDAGCRVFNSNIAGRRTTMRAADDLSTEADDTSPMQIGIITTPAVGSELVLAYGDLWARGYPANDGFVVMAGSEVRSLINPSANTMLHARRAELASANALSDIDGRKRLLVAVWFPSAAIAAKVLSGAQVDSSKWILPRYPQPFIITA
jgi:predicted GIY-YIG superfamily endonuclease